MSEEITVRAAGAGDLPQLLELYDDLIPNDLPAPVTRKQATYDQMLNLPGLTVLLAELDSIVVASLVLLIVPNLTRGCAPYGLIENVITRATHRNRGIGKAMMAAALERAWQNDCYKVMLLSGAANTNAHRFYEDIGFKTTKTGFELRRPGVPPRVPD